nr:MFS transporter [Pseudomonas sp.]
MATRGFYGWRMVYGCMAIATVSWSLCLFGTSVYLHALHEKTGLSIALVSSGISAAYVLAAVSQLWVGNAIARLGPRVVITGGAAAMAIGVAGVGIVQELWQVFATFLVLGAGWACLSTAALTTTLAPWFEQHQGKAASTALLGASLGGMLGVPLLLSGITHIGLTATTTIAAVLAFIIVVLIAMLVLRHRPQDMGLVPDGIPHTTDDRTGTPRQWTRIGALRTLALRTVMIGFGVGLMVQLGFLTHHVNLLLPVLGAPAAAATVTATAVAAFIGRMLLAGWSDRVDVRVTTFALLLVGAASLSLMAVFPSAWVLVSVSIIYGLTVGNVTTLGPIIVRREFGSLSFGLVYGTAATGIQLLSALGPTLYGVLFDHFGSYSAPLLLAAGLQILAATTILRGGRRGASDLNAAH